MNMDDIQPPTKLSPLDKFFLPIGCIDENTLQQCPPNEWQQARGLGMLVFANFLYVGTILSLVSESLFAAPGELRPEPVIGSFFLSFFVVLLIDREAIIRMDLYRQGVVALKKAGIDLGNSTSEWVKSGCIRLVRFVFSSASAGLIGTFSVMLVFSADIHDWEVREKNQINFHIVGPATTLVDDTIERMREAEKAQSMQVNTLASQVAKTRQNIIDPASNDPQLQQSQEELNQLIAQKEKADDNMREAETHASLELGGNKGSGFSGVAGHGPRHKAAMEEVFNARIHAQSVAKALDTARGRVDVLRDKLAPLNERAKQNAESQLPGFEASLDTENAKLVNLRDQLKSLIDGRDEAIRRAVENATDYVPLNTGFLARIKALAALVDENPRIKFILIAIEIVSFSLETAAILATMAISLPTYSALLVRRNYLQLVRIADEMASKLDGISEGKGTETILPANKPAKGYENGMGKPFGFSPFDGANNQPQKRPRGRPRKGPPAIA